ncbi:MAG: SsrA-binding protein SmpB [Alphaproteobacteria bacterium]|jgi:SsrA-binding protein|nr:SsrA-binding protein SmpB [Alphaproteobacteria bacterium]
MNKNKAESVKILAQNRRATFDYAISERFEAGIALKGSEVKSLREGRASIAEGYILRRGTNELELVNSYIPVLKQTAYFMHEEKRSRKLLLHKKEIMKILNFISKKGYTAIPIKLYLKKGLIKLEIGLAKGKTEVDKRQTIKERDWKREQAQVIKQYNIKS